MKGYITASVILGAAAIFSSLIISGNISFKDEHIIQLSGGAIKLGDVYKENKSNDRNKFQESLHFSKTLLNLIQLLIKALRSYKRSLAAGVAELVDARDLKSRVLQKTYRFESDHRYHSKGIFF